jgi:hypothetical protein
VIVDRHGCQLRARVEHGAHACQVAGPNRIVEAPQGYPIDVRFQARPACEPIGACDHELRVVQSERGPVRVVIVAADFGDGPGIAGAKRVEQFLRLPFELIEIGMLGEPASRERMQGHDELLPRLRVASA